MFQRKQTNGAVDLDHLAGELLNGPPIARPADFAPRRPEALIDDAVEKVETFFALPLKEIDEVTAALRENYEAVLARGQTLRDLIMRGRDKHLADIERLRAFTQLAKQAFDTLEQNYSALDRTPAPTAATNGCDNG